MVKFIRKEDCQSIRKKSGGLCKGLTVYLSFCWLLAASGAPLEASPVWYTALGFSSVLTESNLRKNPHPALTLLAGETEVLQFVVENPGNVPLTGLSLKFRLKDEGSTQNINAEFFVVKVWPQMSRFSTTNRIAPLILEMTPELLIKNNIEILPPGCWVNGRYVPPLLAEKLEFFIGANNRTPLMVLVKAVSLPETEQTLSAFVDLVSGSRTLSSLPLTINVLPFKIPDAKRWVNSIYFFASLDPDNDQYVDPARLSLQFKDIRAHGFRSLIVRDSKEEYTRKFFRLARAAGLDGPMALSSNRARADGKAAIELAKTDPIFDDQRPYVYGWDEPNDKKSTEKQVILNRELHTAGVRVVTALRLETDKVLDQEAPLSWSNLHYDEAFHQSLDQMDESLTKRRTYYWQLYMETPVLNRYLCGFYLYHSGLNGVFPFTYQYLPLYSMPYSSDFQPKGAQKARLKTPYKLRKQYLSTYPSAKGPTPTLQWEAVRQGHEDLKLCYLLEQFLSAPWPKDKANRVRAINQGFQSRLDKLCRFYKPNRTLDYLKYERSLALKTQEFRTWILTQLRDIAQ